MRGGWAGSRRAAPARRVTTSMRGPRQRLSRDPTTLPHSHIRDATIATCIVHIQPVSPPPLPRDGAALRARAHPRAAIMIQVFVKHLDGKTLPYSIHASARVSELKDRVFSRCGIDPDEQRLQRSGVRVAYMQMEALRGGLRAG